jgi:quercetin dioxygenase-like cupin family protein
MIAVIFQLKGIVMKKINLKKSVLVFSVTYFVMALLSCNDKKEENSVITETSKKMGFSRGEKVTNNNFIGTVWLNYLAENDTIHNIDIGSVTFEPGARTSWHFHKGGQVLLITAGRGLYQEKGKPIEIIKAGDVIKCPPDREHWHGATPTDEMTHIAIGTNTNMGGAIWLKPVTDQEYHTVLKD